MTHDDTRERLARVSHLAYYGEDLERESQPEKDDWLRMVDAILAEQAAIERERVDE